LPLEISGLTPEQKEAADDAIYDALIDISQQSFETDLDLRKRSDESDGDE